MLLIKKHTGVIIAFFIICCWSLSTWWGFQLELSWSSPWAYCYFFLQTHLYTGLFITAHDAMHNAVSKNKALNQWIGRISAVLFAFNFYDKLNRKHHQHHRFVATDQDPDFHRGGFWAWYLSFAKQYVTIWQILLIAITFNILIQFYPEPNVLIYWALPSIASTFQLFYFGTYLPHRGEHDNKHFSNSQKKNHAWAFFSCYFFGYHYEHHDLPNMPWWQLHIAKDMNEKRPVQS